MYPYQLYVPTTIPTRTHKTITQMNHATALAHIEAVGDRGHALLVETVPTHFPTLEGDACISQPQLVTPPDSDANHKRERNPPICRSHTLTPLF